MDPAFQIEFRDGKGRTFWKSNIGPQTWVLLCPASEILAGGSRGGSKSEALMAWMAMGDPRLAEDDPARYSYLNDPSFRGLILRKHYDDMAEFVDRATHFYRQFGFKPKDNPVVFEHKNGARIYTNHLRDEEAFNKYRGWGLTKIGIEEGTQIEKLKSYMALFGSRRSVERIHRGKVYPKLRTQLLMTANPDGPGAIWIKPRFIEVRSGGKLIPWNTPMTDPITRLTRIFIPMRLKDNPYLKDDPSYLGMLKSQDLVKQKQWIEGDWNAGIGPFFPEYRPQGPIGTIEEAETPWARHLIERADLKPWWYRWGSGDWGYDHPATFHKYCRNEADKRIHVYDELSVRHMDSYELGVKLAGWWLPELEALPDHQITLYLSPDAFSKTDATKTKAEQIGLGIKEVLGPLGSLLLRYTDDERAAASRDPKAAAALFERRKAEVSGQMCIILKPANNDMSAGCDYMRQLFRFYPARSATEEQIKTHLTAVFARSGVEAYERELAQHRDSTPEILPRVQIWACCTGLDRCIRAAQRNEPPQNEEYLKWDFDEEGEAEGDDELDDFRYGCMAYKEIETQIPRSYWVNDRITQFQQANQESFGEEITDPTRLAMIAQRQNAIYAKNNQPAGGGSFTFARAGSTLHRRVQ